MAAKPPSSRRPAVSLSLLDFVFNMPLLGSQTTYLKVGQFKVPYGREQLAYEANLQFADRSINNLGFVVGRDVGRRAWCRIRGC